MAQMIKIEDAVGCPLAHDITEIRPGEYRGAAFRKGHILKLEDLDHLRRLGKDHLYIIKTKKDEMHEDEAAVEIAGALCGQGVGWSGEPREGKINLKASFDGLLKVDEQALLAFNLCGDVMCATIHSNSIVKKNDQVAATRAIPLVVPRDKINAAIRSAKSAPLGVVRVVPMRQANAGVIITGDEVYYGRIQDKFEPVIRKKVQEIGGKVIETVFLPDNDKLISNTALGLIEKGADLLITTGGMSVDADDRTRFALIKAGAQEMVYGAAVLPGAMFMIAYLKNIPVLGIPACGMYASRTILDLIMPRVLAGEKITRTEIAKLGHGGLCLKCRTCAFPRCPFGK